MSVVTGAQVFRTPAFIKSVVFIVVTVLATAVLAATIRNSASGSGSTYHAVFSDVTSLNKGDDVRMSGVKVGTVSKIEVEGRVAAVSFTVDDSISLPAGTTAHLRFRNLVGQRYIAMVQPDLTHDAGPGTSVSAKVTLEPGHTFTLDETEPALDLTLLFNGFQPLFTFLNPEDVNNLSAQIISVFQGEGATLEGLISSTASLTSTLAEKDQVIGELITNLDSVLQSVNDRSAQLDTTIITLDALVSGLAEDRVTIGSTVEGMGALTHSLSHLLEDGRAPLKGSIKGIGDLSANLADSEDVIDQFLQTLPTKFDTIGRIASYGSWFNFYVCSIDGGIPLPEGYMGDLGVDNPAARCR